MDSAPVRRRARLRIALGSAALVACLVPAMPADGYKIDRDLRRWPYAKIGFTDDSKFGWSVTRAVRAWNRADTGYRFVRRDGRQPLRIHGKPGRGKCHANTFPGWDSNGRDIYLSGRCDRYRMVLAVTHEIGHALGLLHSDRKCAVMNSRHVGTGRLSRPKKCRFGKQWWKHPLRRDDIRGAKKLFSLPRPCIEFGNPDCAPPPSDWGGKPPIGTPPGG